MMLEDLYRLLRSGHVQAQGVVDTITQPIVVLDHNLCVVTANNAFIKTFKADRDDIQGRLFFELGNGQWNIDALRQLVAAVIPNAAAVIGFKVSHDFPAIGQRTFLVDARRLAHPDDNSSNVLVLFEDVTERQRHDEEMDFILAETRHRMKNLFAVVRSIAMQTETQGRSALDYRDTLLGRLDVALRAEEIEVSDSPAELKPLLIQTVGPIGMERLECTGPTVSLPSSKVLPISMTFHELATNAAKYGALSVPDGRIQVNWSLQEGPRGRTHLHCEWREQNGPRVEAPDRKGYGTDLIRGTCAHLGGNSELNFAPEGLTAKITIPL